MSSCNNNFFKKNDDEEDEEGLDEDLEELIDHAFNEDGDYNEGALNQYLKDLLFEDREVNLDFKRTSPYFFRILKKLFKDHGIIRKEREINLKLKLMMKKELLKR